MRRNRTRIASAAAAALTLPAALTACEQVDLIRLYLANNGTAVQTARSLPITLPYKDVGGWILLPARVNGQAPIDFVLDTGADVPVLLQGERTRHLGLDMKRARKLGSQDDLAAPTGARQDGLDIDFGGVVFKDQMAIAVPEAKLACRGAATRKAPFTGVIGHDFFRRFTVEVNRDNGTVILHDPDRYNYRGAGRTVPLEFDGRQIYAKAIVTPPGARPYDARLHVDTGAGAGTPLTLIPGSKPEIVAPAAGETKHACFVGGGATYRVGAPVMLDLAGAKAPAEVRYAISREVAGSKENGRIGAPLLARFNVIFDYPRKRMILEPRRAASIEETKRKGTPPRPPAEATKPG